ncbi:inorganic phosphate transporter [Lentzea flaviverrucosa]|uniref:Phosphate transporter n=1 Tax=Lentzea flaviverrucosa TaxID=200379 RepID=A0A1H9VDU4_9PSEU|nr:inorganic phosphate transporter [Lentzea flaviverrucosa]RDI23919.1 PiT family inorganic phosphate transporter [Lentzea flaviverrucosa]SES19614.1 inorganic phosphate transporter, PiT family [Lentzea flaviverrucosa]
MDPALVVIIVVITALIFDFTNGFHDTANAMATSIATGALKPRTAVALSAVLNLVGAFLSVEVAKTISGGIVDDAQITPAIIFGGLVGAIMWNLVTWYVGLPSSSSHALFGGLIGAAWVASGVDAIHFVKVVDKVLVPAIVAPLVAGLVAAIATIVVYRLKKAADPRVSHTGFKVGQVASASLVSLAHGTNDAQKTMGIITLALITSGSLAPGSGPPTWVIVSAGLAIAAGTYLGGWRITHTMGRGLTTIEPAQGFAAQTSTATAILASSHLGFALSTTHVASGGIMGSGLGRDRHGVNWGTMGKMAAGWLFTLPAAGIVGALAGKWASTGAVGIIGVATIGIAVSIGIWILARREPIKPEHIVDEVAAQAELHKVAA